MTMTLNVQRHYNPSGDPIELASSAHGLLLKRMRALQIEPTEARRIESSVFGDLVEACTGCEEKERCTKDLAATGAMGWENYCPNASILNAMAALPWFRKSGQEN